MTTYYSRVQYTGDGTLNPKAVTFPYIQQSYVEVYINGVLKAVTTDYTWPSSTTIAPTVAWPSGALIEFRRNTPKSTSLVNFADGGALDEALLDLNTAQLLQVAQESIDAVGDGAQVYATQAAASAGTATTEANAASASAVAAAASEVSAASDATAAAASAASINPTTLVHNTGNEAVGGIKTFSSSPVVPDATGATQAASKGQMDAADAATLAGAIAAGFGVGQALTAPANVSGTTYYNTSGKPRYVTVLGINGTTSVTGTVSIDAGPARAFCGCALPSGVAFAGGSFVVQPSESYVVGGITTVSSWTERG